SAEAPFGVLRALLLGSARGVAVPGAVTRRPITRVGAFFATGAVSSFCASTIMTPPNPRDSRAPMRSKAGADLISTGDSIGGTKRAADQSNELNIDSVRSVSSWVRL